MKRTFTSSFLGLAISGLLLASCSQMASYENEDLALEQARADKEGFTLSPYGNIGSNYNAALMDCSECITEPQVQNTVMSKVTGPPQSPTITPYSEYQVWNTETEIVLTFSMYGTAGADNMTVEINGTSYTWEKDGVKDPSYTDVLTAGNGKILSFKISQLLDDKTSCTLYPVIVSYSGGPGGSLSESTSYSIYEYCSESCEESFLYKKNDNGTYTFTYIPASDIVDAELVFTFAQNSVKSAQDGWEDKGQTYQKTMNLDACQEYNWTFTLDCKDLNNVQNLWTDFKVDGVSKKGSLVNIKCE